MRNAVILLKSSLKMLQSADEIFPDLSIFDAIKEKFRRLPNTSVAWTCAEIAACLGPRTPVNHVQRAELPLDSSGGAILERALAHLTQQWSDDDFPISRAIWMSSEMALSYLVSEADSNNNLAKHVLVLLLHISKCKKPLLEQWSKFVNELDAWVSVDDIAGVSSLKMVLLRASDLSGLHFDINERDSTTGNISANVVEQRWIADTLLDAAVLEAIVSLLTTPNQFGQSTGSNTAMFSSVSASRVRASLQKMQISLIRNESAPLTRMRGWVTFNGICIVVNHFGESDDRHELAMIARNDSRRCDLFRSVLHESVHFVPRDCSGSLDFSSPFSYESATTAAANSNFRYLLPSARETDSNKGTTMNFELGQAAERAVIGIVIAFPAALKSGRTKFQQLVDLTQAILGWKDQPQRKLPILSKHDICGVTENGFQSTSIITAAGLDCIDDEDSFDME